MPVHLLQGERRVLLCLFRQVGVYPWVFTSAFGLHSNTVSLFLLKLFRHGLPRDHFVVTYVPLTHPEFLKISLPLGPKMPQTHLAYSLLQSRNELCCRVWRTGLETQVWVLACPAAPGLTAPGASRGAEPGRVCVR